MSPPACCSMPFTFPSNLTRHVATSSFFISFKAHIRASKRSWPRTGLVGTVLSTEFATGYRASAAAWSLTKPAVRDERSFEKKVKTRWTLLINAFGQHSARLSAVSALNQMKKILVATCLGIATQVAGRRVVFLSVPIQPGQLVVLKILRRDGRQCAEYIRVATDDFDLRGFGGT
mgnify:CR=1 FL=1